MEYIYAALLLHSAKKEINEKNVESILKAVGVEADAARIKALTASLQGINITEAIATPAVVAAAPAATQQPAAGERKEAKKEEKKEEKVSDEEAAAGLSALFG